jgi:hypothetical protein
MSEKEVSKDAVGPSDDAPFENEPADAGREAYKRGGPIRTGEPERDYFIEQNTAVEKATESGAAADTSGTRRTSR